MNNYNKKILSDKDILMDALFTEQNMTLLYHHFLNQCSTTILRDDILDILNDEYKVENLIFPELQNQGWYLPLKAKKEDIKLLYQKYTSLPKSQYFD